MSVPPQQSNMTGKLSVSMLTMLCNVPGLHPVLHFAPAYNCHFEAVLDARPLTPGRATGRCAVAKCRVQSPWYLLDRVMTVSSAVILLLTPATSARASKCLQYLAYGVADCTTD